MEPPWRTHLDPNLVRAAGHELEDLGYIGGPIGEDEEAVIRALREYEETSGREGLIDWERPPDENLTVVVADLERRFCGIPEARRDGFAGPLRPQTFGAPGGRWTRGNLTWSFDPTGCVGMTAVAVFNTLRQAFTAWQTANPFFAFTNVMNNGDFRLSFVGDDVIERFGARGKTAGVAYYPPDGRIFFDSAEVWDPNFLASIARHEIGHALGLEHSTANGSTMYPFAPNGGIDAESAAGLVELYGWPPPRRFADDRSSSDGPALAVTTEMSFEASATSVHMAWKGVDGDSAVWFSSSDDEGNTWSEQRPLNGIRSSHGPALTGFTRVPGSMGLFLAWKGEGSDERLYFARSLDRQQFEPHQQVAGCSSNARPALAEFDGRVHMAWKAATGDHLLWSSFGEGGWTEQVALAGRYTSHAPSLAVVGDRLYMFWQGMGEDTRLFHAWLPAGPDAIWSPGVAVAFARADVEGMVWEDIHTSHHPVATFHRGDLLVAYKGQPGDDAVWYTRRVGEEWSGPIQVRDALTSTGPGAASLPSGRLVLCWKAQAPDQQYHFTMQ